MSKQGNMVEVQFASMKNGFSGGEVSFWSSDEALFVDKDGNAFEDNSRYIITIAQTGHTLYIYGVAGSDSSSLKSLEIDEDGEYLEAAIEAVKDLIVQHLSNGDFDEAAHDLAYLTVNGFEDPEDAIGDFDSEWQYKFGNGDFLEANDPGGPSFFANVEMAEGISLEISEDGIFPEDDWSDVRNDSKTYVGITVS